jgi:hypothetical protein
VVTVAADDVVLSAVDEPPLLLLTVTADFSGLNRFLRVRLAIVPPFSAPFSCDALKTRPPRISSVISLASDAAGESVMRTAG